MEAASLALSERNKIYLHTELFYWICAAVSAPGKGLAAAIILLRKKNALSRLYLFKPITILSSVLGSEPRMGGEAWH